MTLLKLTDVWHHTTFWCCCKDLGSSNVCLHYVDVIGALKRFSWSVIRLFLNKLYKQAINNIKAAHYQSFVIGSSNDKNTAYQPLDANESSLGVGHMAICMRHMLCNTIHRIMFHYGISVVVTHGLYFCIAQPLWYGQLVGACSECPA